MSYLGSFTRQQLMNMLKEAQDAYHELMTGNKAVTINRSGRSVTYSPAEKDSLRNYISELNIELGNNQGVAGQRSAGRVIF